MNLQSLIKTALYRLGFSIRKIRPRRVTTSAAGSAREVPPDAGELHALLHKEDLFAGFDYQRIPLDLHGWGSQSPAFAELIREQRPRLIIEVGTWKGGSALEMARLLEEASLPAAILCIDTWLGALEFWTELDDPQRHGSLKLKHGYPSVYYQFLANVCHRGAQKRIVPFPQTSSIAGLWLRHYGIRADLIYLDGSHEEEDVYEDLLRYWEVLADGGVLFGDDYSWDGVRLAVERFAREEGIGIAFLADKWVLRKKR
ncbi:MAG: CmcI family methyltransferase [Verrucomicrobiota bacterium]